MDGCIVFVYNRLLSLLTLILIAENVGRTHRIQNNSPRSSRYTLYPCNIGVGKSSMLIRYMKGNFSEQYQVTVGVEFATKHVAIDDKKEVRIQIWDTVRIFLCSGGAGGIQGDSEDFL